MKGGGGYLGKRRVPGEGYRGDASTIVPGFFFSLSQPAPDLFPPLLCKHLCEGHAPLSAWKRWRLRPGHGAAPGDCLEGEEERGGGGTLGTWRERSRGRGEGGYLEGEEQLSGGHLEGGGDE